MKKNLRIIGLGYKIGSGKDTVADILCDEYGYNKLRFASALKELVSIVFGWPLAALDDQQFKAKVDKFWGVAPRTILQRVGTEAMRQNVRDDIWIKALELRIKKLSSSSVLPWIVIPDMRFINEANAIKQWGGITVNVTRPNNPYITPENQQHASETELDSYQDWDATLINDAGLADFIRRIRDYHPTLVKLLEAKNAAQQ